MARDLHSLAEDYALVWDVSAPNDLADRLFAPDVVDHNVQPGQGPGWRASGRSSPSITLSFLTCASAPTMWWSRVTGSSCDGALPVRMKEINWAFRRRTGRFALPGSTSSASKMDGSSNVGARRTR